MKGRREIQPVAQPAPPQPMPPFTLALYVDPASGKIEIVPIGIGLTYAQVTQVLDLARTEVIKRQIEAEKAEVPKA